MYCLEKWMIWYGYEDLHCLIYAMLLRSGSMLLMMVESSSCQQLCRVHSDHEHMCSDTHLQSIWEAVIGSRPDHIGPDYHGFSFSLFWEILFECSWDILRFQADKKIQALLLTLCSYTSLQENVKNKTIKNKNNRNTKMKLNKIKIKQNNYYLT